MYLSNLQDPASCGICCILAAPGRDVVCDCANVFRVKNPRCPWGAIDGVSKNELFKSIKGFSQRGVGIICPHVLDLFGGRGTRRKVQWKMEG